MLDVIAPAPTREEQVYVRLRRAVIEGTLIPGQDVVVTTVAAQLGVSRIPVMHACQRLIGEGFLVANPRRSVTVAPITEDRIAEGTAVLITLECLAIERAVSLATEDLIQELERLNEAVRVFRREPGTLGVNLSDYQFHTTLWRAAGMPYLAQQISLVYDHHEPSRALARVAHNAARSAGEHEHIIDALTRQDVRAAQDALRHHRLQGAERALAALQAQRSLTQSDTATR